MKQYLLTLCAVIFLVSSGKALASNHESFRFALARASHIELMLLNGATDSECLQIAATLHTLGPVFGALTTAQKRVLGQRYPRFQFTACRHDIAMCEERR